MDTGAQNEYPNVREVGASLPRAREGQSQRSKARDRPERQPPYATLPSHERGAERVPGDRVLILIASSRLPDKPEPLARSQAPRAFPAPREWRALGVLSSRRVTPAGGRHATAA